MILSFHPCLMADEQVILGDRPLGREDFDLIQKAGAILLPQGCSYALYRACKESPALLFPDFDMRFAYPGKNGQARLFRERDDPHPFTSTWSSVDQFRDALREKGVLPHEPPFFLKADASHEAEGVYLIEDIKDLESALGILASYERSGYPGFVSQEMVPSEGNVLRVVIMGKKLLSYWKRPSSPAEMITTLSRGSLLDKEWRMDLQEKGRSQVMRFSKETGVNLAAFDLLFPFTSPDPQPLFLEINWFFGRRGLGGSLNYYRLLYVAVQEWLEENGVGSSVLSLA